MIARVWKGSVLASDAEEYVRLMHEVAIPGYRATDGNQGAWCLTRSIGQTTEIVMLTFWSNREAIERFAGPKIELARYYDFDDRFLLWKNPHVQHFDA